VRPVRRAAAGDDAVSETVAFMSAGEQ